MVENKPTKTNQQNETNETFKGISIGSFLQMLEHEKSSCTVRVQSDNKFGTLFFSKGNLIDAQNGNATGIEAAYAIISWENTSISLNNAVERTKRIDFPLGYILLNGAKQQDEQKDKGPTTALAPQPEITYMLQEAKSDPDFQKSVSILSHIPAIRHFYLLNKAGEIVVHSAPNTTLRGLIIHFIITSSNLQQTIKTKAPQRIILQMKDGSSLLIVSLAGKIIAAVLHADYSADEIAKQIRSELLT